MTTKYTARDLIEMLRSKYPLPAYAFIEQVPDGTSVNKNRTADAIAMGCWKSVAIELNGFEVKVSRADWLKELQQPEKSAVFQKHCHRWWIVAAPGIVKLEEMPAEWGLMEPNSSGALKIKKASSLRTPEPVSFEFLAGLLRKACSDSPERSVIEAAKNKAEKEGYERGRKSVHGSSSSEYTKSVEREAERLREAIDEFEKTSGCKIEHWNAGDVGEAVRAVMSFKVWNKWLIRDASNLVKRSKEILDHAKSIEANMSNGLEFKECSTNSSTT